MNYQANVYPKNGVNTTVKYSDQSKSNIGICFSGGGSRALTCAWGQMLGLQTANIFNKARYISSVSGGTWATSIYSFLPENITDVDLLGTYFTPENLSLQTQSGKFNVNNLGSYSIGNSPNGMHLGELLVLSGVFLLLNKKSDYKWLWASLVAQRVLNPFNLRAKGNKIWNSTNYFSLSETYVSNNFPTQAPTKDQLYFLRSGRPFPIMNNNIIIPLTNPNSAVGNTILMPNQVTPVAGGVRGVSPNGSPIGGGFVESYGVSSTLNQSGVSGAEVNVEVDQPYSLIDIVSTSSAFFAGTIAQYLDEQLQDPEKKKNFITELEKALSEENKKSLLQDLEDGVEDILDVIEKRLDGIFLDNFVGLTSIIPTYNYWPVATVSENKEMQFADGGNLDNTGILGMLSQTELGTHNNDPINIIAFDNTDTPLEKKAGKIIAANQAAALFGIDFETGLPFTQEQKDPNNKAFKNTSLITVFQNSLDSNGATKFQNLVNGLYASNCGSLEGVPNDSKVNTAPAFFEMELTTVENQIAGVSVGRKVNLLYIQNAKMLNWQNQIGDTNLKEAIIEGQEAQNDILKKINPKTPFLNFPYYSTFLKVGLTPEESNSLSQMWAWAIADSQSQLKPVIERFLNK